MILFLTNCHKKLEIHMQKIKSRHRLYTFYKINSTCIIILNIQKYITFLEDNVGKNLGDHKSGNEVLDTTSKS